MPQSLAKIYLHIIFSTKNRDPLIEAELDSELYAYLGSICRSMHCPPIEIGGSSDHIHVACCLGRSTTASKMVEELKSHSSKWIKSKGQRYTSFYWQKGYAAFSVGQSQLEHLQKYIQRQREHHKRISFQEEYRNFLQKYEVAYDERYVWD